MTWREALLSLQLAAEERVGAPYRRAMREAKALEDAAASQVKEALDGPR